MSIPEHVFEAGEHLSAGMFVTPDRQGRIFRAKDGDPMVGAMGVLDDCAPGDFVHFPQPRGGLGRRLNDRRSEG
jgi:hypothetical protein